MKEDDDFYEVLPYAPVQPYRQELLEHDELEARAKRTAIITLVLALAVSLALIIAIVQGLGMIHSAYGI